MVISVYTLWFVKKQLGEALSSAILGFHVFSGCDSVSSLRGKGKRSIFNVMQGNPQHMAAFSQLGNEWILTKPLMRQLELFTAEVYGLKDCCDINTARYRCFLLGHHTDRSLPPNQDSLNLHISRANYQDMKLETMLVFVSYVGVVVCIASNPPKMWTEEVLGEFGGV